MMVVGLHHKDNHHHKDKRRKTATHLERVISRWIVMHVKKPGSALLVMGQERGAQHVKVQESIATPAKVLANVRNAKEKGNVLHVAVPVRGCVLGVKEI